MGKFARFWFPLSIVVSVVALVASAILFVDYVRPSPAFCDAEGGCGLVKRTIFAFPLGIPTPLIGMAGFLATAMLGLVSGRRMRIAQAMLAVFGAIVAASLITVQAIMKTVCPYCVVADTAALVLMALAILRAVKSVDPPEGKMKIGGATAALVVAIALPLVIGFTKKPLSEELPDVIAREIQKTPRGKVTVVDFVDFECPFCRMTNAELEPLLAERKDEVRVTRKNVPLRMHRHAMDAARTACCAEEMGKGDEIADALFTTPADDLTPEGCEKLATERGLDIEKFRQCVRSPDTDARIRADTETFRAAHGHGLPMLYIGEQRLVGSQQQETLRAALDSAKRAL